MDLVVVVITHWLDVVYNILTTNTTLLEELFTVLSTQLVYLVLSYCVYSNVGFKAV